MNENRYRYEWPAETGRERLQREISELKSLLRQAYDRFTDADFVPANHELKAWQAKTLKALS